jgi:small subunit ribosomal protein S27Ae
MSKETTSAKAKKKKPMSAKYKIEDGKIKRLLPICERCGPGYFMADHGDRYACGHCGFTRYKTGKTQGK